MRYEIVWQDSRGYKPRRTYEFLSIGHARDFARDLGVADRGKPWTVLAVLPLPTKKQEDDALFGLLVQYAHANEVRLGNPEACITRKDIQQSVQDDLFYNDERVSTAFFLGQDWLYWEG